MKYLLEEIDYKRIFYYFEMISNIPRGSKYNKKISDYLVQFAIEHGLRYVQDDLLNVVIYKNASIGYEDKPGIIIQAHMDMVCEKTQDSTHDFEKEGLELIIEDGYVKAKDTTLGADDGIGVAYALAFLEDDTNKHPFVEVLITTDEEIGMDGSIGLDGNLLNGKYLLNIDSEDEGIFLSSCAGGMTTESSIPLEYELNKGIRANIQIKGLNGGHSGTEIDKKGQNATLLLGRLIKKITRKININFINMVGGNRDNVIPCEANASVLIDKTKKDYFINLVEDINKQLFNEIADVEKDYSIEVTILDNEEIEYETLNKKSFDAVINMLTIIPNGVMVMSSKVDNLVESSLNLGIFKIDDNALRVVHSIRSSVTEYKYYLFDKVNTVFELCGGNTRSISEYPAWEYNNNSHLRELSCKVYENMFEKSAKIEAIHAGLECGILAEKINNPDMVSFGPNIDDIHTIKEKLDINSTKRMYDFMEKIIELL